MQYDTLVLQLGARIIGLLLHLSPASPVLYCRTLHTHPGVLIGRGLGNQHRDETQMRESAVTLPREGSCHHRLSRHRL